MVGVAVKVTEVPEHMVVAEAPMLTLTGRSGFTVIVVAGDVAGLPVGQVALEVSTQVTASLLLNDVDVKVALFVPAFTPFTCH